jgi:hypothetical protein
MRRTILAGVSIVLLLIGGAARANAAEGQSHGGEHAPPPPHMSGPQTAHVNPELKGHTTIHVAPKDIPHEGGVSIFGGTEHRPDGWRYRYEKGVWWYWGPKNHWMYYDNGDWQSDAVDEAPVAGVPVASDPNFYWYNNKWWYLRGEHWLIYDHNKWGDGPVGVHPPLREMGHGPVVHPHEDEHHEDVHHDEHEHK